jgi:hypothetical protein
MIFYAGNTPQHSILKCFSGGHRLDRFGDGQLHDGARRIARRQSERRIFAATGKNRAFDYRRAFDALGIDEFFRQSNAAGALGFGNRFDLDVRSADVLYVEGI